MPKRFEETMRLEGGLLSELRAELRERIKREGWLNTSRQVGVAVSIMQSFLAETKCPRIHNVALIARALGFELRPVRRRRKATRASEPGEPGPAA